MSHGSLNQGRQGEAAERCLPSARTKHGVARGSSEIIAGVRFIAASGLSIPRTSCQARSTGRSAASEHTDHAQTPAEHHSCIALVRKKNWLDLGRDCDARTERLSQCPTQAWLRGVAAEVSFTSSSTMRLIVCGRQSLHRLMKFSCLGASGAPARL
jgi:hypothetical protein